MNRSISAKATIWSNLCWISRRDMPMIEPFREMFSRPLSSGWKPAPTSMRAPSRPWATNEPEVGTVTRERILSSVLFPAPLAPTSPSISPRSSEKLTSLSAQNSSRGSTRRPSSRAVSRPTSSLIEVTYQPRRRR